MAPTIPSPDPPEAVPRSDNNKTHPPEWKEDILNLRSLKDLSDSEKERLLENSGYMFGIRVDRVVGPIRAMCQVAKRRLGSMPCVRELDITATEVVPTKNKRDANYAHEGWSTLAISAIPHWTFLRATSSNVGTPNQEGDWVTKRFMRQRLALDLLAQDLEPDPRFEADITAALAKSTKFDQIQALYRVLDAWGDVVPLEFDVGFSLAVTDLEANFLPSADMGSLSLQLLLKVNTTRTMKQQGGDPSLSGSDVGQWLGRKVPAAQWSQIRIRKVIPTICLLNDELQNKLEALRSDIRSLSPASITGTVEHHESVDDDPKTVRPIALVTLRSNTMVDSLTFTYVDGGRSDQHGGQCGMEHKFRLDSGEHITEIIALSGSENDAEWICGIQFVTSKGRVSKHYGGSAGRPAVLRSENGVLVGLHSMIRQHPKWKTNILSNLQAIWRHDILSSVPKQSDVFSDYIGSNNGAPLNGRTIVGNSKSMRISKIDISWGGVVDNLQLTYIDDECSSMTSCATAYHGGPPWASFRSTFELETGEHIVTISGRYNDENIAQLCFITNLGRTSDVFGGGGGKPFSQRAPLDANGRGMRLQYMFSKSDKYLNGVMFVWTSV